LADVQVLLLEGVVKDYRGLRPLRIKHLAVGEAQSVALLGFDQAAAEVFVNLVTGATVPDAGEVRVFGKPTAATTDADSWLASLDDFGILSERAVLLEALTGMQNLAMPFSLEVDPIPDSVRPQVGSLAEEVGLEPGEAQRPVGDLTPLARARVRLGRALALNPRVLVAEHPNAMVAGTDVPVLAADLARTVAARKLTSVIVTADRTFAAAVAERVLTLQPASGELRADAGWRRWFGG
jgi:predicted ABC-type transport system involved in lysophospholipase L1 biosynthesis ATPase subunit